MEKNYKFYITLMLLPLLLMLSCQKVDLHHGAANDKGLLNFFVSIPGQATQYNATVAGPYLDGDTIYVKVPTTEDDPIDLSGLKPSASLENNSRIVPGLPGIIDFRHPYEMTVMNGNGVSKRYIVKVLPTLPRTLFKKMWFYNATDMGILRTNISGLAVVNDKLLIADFNGGTNGATVGVRVYDKLTGAYQKIIAPPTTYAMQVTADDANHFAVNRYNIYGAGFMLYYYENVDAAPRLMLNYTAALGCPVNLGARVSIIGNLKEGKAYVYATTTTIDNNIYYWEFNDGIPVSAVPTVMKYAGADAWTFAAVKRKSLDAASDHYIAYCNYITTDTDLKKGSRFEQFSTNMDVQQMNPKNHFYKILNFDVFEIKGTVFVAMLTQGFAAWDATHIKVYDITDPKKMTLVADDAGYTDFMLFTSEAYGGTNYNRYGDISVDVSGNEARIYATMATNAAANAGVMAYVMKYNP